MTPDERAQKSSQAMWEGDDASKWIGMSLIEVKEATATLEVTVEKHHCNGHGSCHGGVIYSLADSAFAFACNSRNQATVAQHNTITYLAPGFLNDTLTAHAVETSLIGRTGIYDVRVTNQNDDVIAEFRGCSRTIKGQLFKE
jgi:acyl-CoA thioesterase